MLEVDEGDPFNKLLSAKSINNMKARGIFQNVESKIVDTEDGNLKNIEITVEEKATGEILVGAGVGSEGGTAQFSVSENNFLGKGVKLSTGLRISETRLRGNFTVTNPNFNYTDKALFTDIFVEIKCVKMNSHRWNIRWKLLKMLTYIFEVQILNRFR